MSDGNCQHGFRLGKGCKACALDEGSLSASAGSAFLRWLDKSRYSTSTSDVQLALKEAWDAVHGDGWALVAWPKVSGGEYLLLAGRYETREGAELASATAAKIHGRTVMVVSVGKPNGKDHS